MTSDKKKRSQDAGEVCPDCNGRGWKDSLCESSAHALVCASCNGAGVTVSGMECAVCKGSGRIDERTFAKTACPTCKGAGIYPVPEGLELKYYAFRQGRR